MIARDAESVEYRDDSGRIFHFGQHAEQSLAKRLDIAPGYMARCPAELRTMNYNYWMKRSGDLGLVARRVGQGEYDILSVALSGFVPVENGTLVRMLAETLMPVLKRSGCELGDLKLVRSAQDDGTGRLALNLVLPGGRHVGARSVGDVVECGFHLLSDPAGDVGLKLTPYYLRLVCSNGMTAFHGVPHARWTRRRGPGGNDRELRAWMAEIVSSIEGGIWDEHFHQMDVLADSPVDRDLATQLIRNLGRRFGDSHLTRSVQRRREDEHAASETYWNLVNYFSGAAHSQDDTDHIRLEAMAGRALEDLHHLQYCDTCHRPLS
jgi:hypothetical protein